MKCLLNKWFKERSIRNNNSLEDLIPNMTSQVGRMFFCAICIGMFLSGDGDRLKLTVASISPQKSASNIDIDRIATNISIRILDRDFLGSGFIVLRSDREYIAITNQHVLRAGEAPYTVETFDGKTYRAEIITNMDTSGDRYDLAILKFEVDTDAVYKTAKLGSSRDLQVGESVVAVGFPYQEPLSKVDATIPDRQISSARKLALKRGRVAIVLDRALEEGYQIGYTNNVKKGMSGGPLLNLRGEAIGVNGKHAYPLWESPEIYQDGTEPCPALQELITRLSLAIPIEKSINLATELKSLESAVALEYQVRSNLDDKDELLIKRMQSEAEDTKRQCYEYERPFPEPNNTLEDVFEAP